VGSLLCITPFQFSDIICINSIICEANITDIICSTRVICDTTVTDIIRITSIICSANSNDIITIPYNISDTIFLDIIAISSIICRARITDIIVITGIVFSSNVTGVKLENMGEQKSYVWYYCYCFPYLKRRQMIPVLTNKNPLWLHWIQFLVITQPHPYIIGGPPSITTGALNPLLLSLQQNVLDVSLYG